jgi:tetratricopeptide (TPR) repeat protein
MKIARAAALIFGLLGTSAPSLFAEDAAAARRSIDGAIQRLVQVGQQELLNTGHAALAPDELTALMQKVGLQPGDLGQVIKRLQDADMLMGAGNPTVGAAAPADPARYGLLNAADNLAVQQNPGDMNYVGNRGIDQVRQGNLQAGYDDLSAVVQAGNPSHDVLAAYGRAAYGLGDFKSAATAAQEMLQAAPNDPEALGLYHMSADHAPALRLPLSLGETASNQGGGATPSGMTAGQADPAWERLAPGSDAQSRSTQFARDTAGAMRVRDYEAAYSLASRAIALNPQNAQALNFRAMALTQMRRYPEAARDASAALDLAPGNAAALHTRSWAFSKQGKYKEALQDAESASAAEPSNALLYQDKALALAGLGDRRGALDALRRSAALDPRFATRLERAVQQPQDADMTLLFDDGSLASTTAVPAPSSRSRRFLNLAGLSALGGLLIALGVLHVVSASWRERVHATVRRALGHAAPAAAEGVAGSPSLGSFWAQYEVVRKIGLGGMGVVYEAKDRSLERRVAVKKMRDEIRLDPQERRRFVNEARLVAQLHHPGIVDVYGIIEDDMDVYLVFEFVEGRTLQDALTEGPMDLPQVRQVIKEIADAVEHAHGRGIIHRDLKPSNVMLTSEGRVKVMDFGVARQAKDALTRHSMTNTVAGTPPYMAPEQEQGTVRKESDVYALGVCLYEMATGSLPFTGSGAAMLLNKLNGKLTPACRRNPRLPAGLDAVIARALEPDADKRYRTPAELVAALDALLAPAANSQR